MIVKDAPKKHTRDTNRIFSTSTAPFFFSTYTRSAIISGSPMLSTSTPVTASLTSSITSVMLTKKRLSAFS